MFENEADFEKTVRRLNIDDRPNQAHRKTLRREMLSVFDETTQQTQRRTTPLSVFRRTIMRSRIAKLATAATIIVAAALAWTVFDKSATPAYGITDVPGLFNKSKAIHIRGWVHFNLTDRGSKVPKAPVERWIDLENGRARFSGTIVNAGPEQVTVEIKETILSGQYKMVLYHSRKQAVFYRMSDYQRMLQTHDCLQDMFGRLFGNIEDLNNIAKSGEEEIDGVAYDVWACEFKETTPDRNRANRYKYWLSPTTGETGRFQSWYKNGEEPWKLGHDYYEIERDVDIPEETFAMEIPEGYEAINSKETAGLLELDEGGYFGTSDLALDNRISFTLSNGSVILAWRGVDTESKVSQMELFEGLKFGGTLPKLPVEIYSLKPRGWTGSTTYTARHLAYTRKGDNLIEWSLYVPEGPWPKRSETFGYELLCRVNSEKQMVYWPGSSVDYGIKIETKEEFDTWVLGAMAELSDEGDIPDDVTYESVLQLTR